MGGRTGRGSRSRGGRPALGAGFEAAALLLPPPRPPSSPLATAPAPPPGRVALAARPLPLAGSSRPLNEPVVLWRLAGVLSSDEDAGPAPPHPSPPLWPLLARPPPGPAAGTFPAGLAARRSEPALPRQPLASPAAAYLARKQPWQTGVLGGGELPAQRPRPGGPPGKKLWNCGCHSAQSQKGVYYLLARSAGDAPALIALSRGFSPTEAHVQMLTSFIQSTMLLERFTLARYLGEGAAWIVFSP